MTRALVIVIFGLAPFLGSAQNDLKVFKTYDDFVNKVGEEYSFHRLFWPTAKGIGLIVERGNEKIKINGKDIWGYSYKDGLFRYDRNHNQPVRVMSIGKIIYYENGQASMEMLRKNKEYSDFRFGYYCYVSKSLATDIIPLDNYVFGDTKSKISAFKKQYAEFKVFFDCLGKRYEYDKVRLCIKEFEGH
jgi:hypothetical protein